MDEAVEAIVANILSEIGCVIRPETGHVARSRPDQVMLEADFVAQFEANAEPAADLDQPSPLGETSKSESAEEEQEDQGETCAQILDMVPQSVTAPEDEEMAAPDSSILQLASGDSTLSNDSTSLEVGTAPLAAGYPKLPNGNTSLASSGTLLTNSNRMLAGSNDHMPMREVAPEHGTDVAFASPDDTFGDPARQGDGSEQIEMATDDLPVEASGETRPEPKHASPLVPEKHVPETDVAVQPQNERAERREADAPARSAPAAHSTTWHTPVPIRQSPDMIITRKDDVIELRLTPEELGNLRIMVANRDQVQHVTFLLERPEVLDQFRRHAEVMTRQLSEAGIEGSNLEFRQDRGQEQNRSDPRQPRDMSNPATQVPEQTVSLTLTASTRPNAHDTRLDLRM